MAIYGIIGRLESRRGVKVELKKYLPHFVAITYAAIYVGILLKNVVYSVSDQTDVIRAGIAAFPFGWVLSYVYLGDRNGAFFAVSCCAVLNTFAIFYYTRSLIRNSN